MTHASTSKLSLATTLESDDGAIALLDFNREVIAQATSLLDLFDSHHAAAFAGPVGAHLRHIIEHYDALLSPAIAGFVDYDARVRDRALERSTALARRRLVALSRRLVANNVPLNSPTQVRGQGGLAGDFNFTISSTFGRELVFVASHALHHYALMRPYCQKAGILLSEDFGKAPSTVAHERATTASTNSKTPA